MYSVSMNNQDMTHRNPIIIKNGGKYKTNVLPEWILIASSRSRRLQNANSRSHWFSGPRSRLCSICLHVRVGCATNTGQSTVHMLRTLRIVRILHVLRTLHFLSLLRLDHVQIFFIPFVKFIDIYRCLVSPTVLGDPALLRPHLPCKGIWLADPPGCWNTICRSVSTGIERLGARTHLLPVPGHVHCPRQLLVSAQRLVPVYV